MPITTVRPQTAAFGQCVHNVLVGLRPVPEIVVLAIDVSPSMEETDWSPSRLHGAQDAAVAFVMRKRQNCPRDWLGLVSYASNARVVHGPLPVETGHEGMCCAIRSLQTSCGTDIGAGLAEANRTFTRHAAIRHVVTRVGFWGWLCSLLRPSHRHALIALPQEAARRIILLTDGQHNGSVDPLKVAEQCRQRGVEIDCIGIGGSPKEVDEELLKRVASVDEAGRARYWFIGERTQLIRKFEQLATGLRAS